VFFSSLKQLRFLVKRPPKAVFAPFSFVLSSRKVTLLASFLAYFIGHRLFSHNGNRFAHRLGVCSSSP